MSSRSPTARQDFRPSVASNFEEQSKLDDDTPDIILTPKTMAELRIDELDNLASEMSDVSPDVASLAVSRVVDNVKICRQLSIAVKASDQPGAGIDNGFSFQMKPKQQQARQSGKKRLPAVFNGLQSSASLQNVLHHSVLEKYIVQQATDKTKHEHNYRAESNPSDSAAKSTTFLSHRDDARSTTPMICASVEIVQTTDSPDSVTNKFQLDEDNTDTQALAKNTAETDSGSSTELRERHSEEEHGQPFVNGAHSANPQMDKMKVVQNSPSDVSMQVSTESSGTAHDGTPTKFSKPSCHGRVQKTKSTFPGIRTSNRAKAPSQGLPSNEKQPSEEDLLYLLMHRKRQRERLIANDHQRLLYLEEINQELQITKKTLEEEFRHVTDERDNLLDQSGTIRDELELFKSKYQKLKAWALEMNKEYAEVRQEGIDIKSAISGLRQQNETMMEPTKSALQFNNQAIENMKVLKKDLDESRQSLLALRDDLQQARQTIASQETELRTLKALEQKHEAYNQDLLAQQAQFNERTTSHQQRLTKAMETLTSHLHTIPTLITKHGELGECVKLIKDLSQRDNIAATGLASLEKQMTGLANSLLCVREWLSADYYEREDDPTPEDLHNEILSIKTRLEDLITDSAAVRELEKTNAILEERTSGDVKIQQLLQEAKSTAETQRNEIRESNEALKQSFAKFGQPNDDAKARKISELETQISRDGIMLSGARKQSAEIETRLKASEADVSNLKTRLEQLQKDKDKEVSRVLVQHEHELEILKRKNHTAQSEIRAEIDSRVSAHEQAVLESKDALHQANTKIRIAEQNRANLSAEHAKLVQALQIAQQDNNDTRAELNTYNKTISSLKREIERTQQEANEAVQFRQRHKDQTEFVSELQTKLKQLHSMRLQYENAQAECKGYVTTISALQEKLHVCEEELAANADIQQQNIQNVNELKACQLKLIRADANLVSLTEARADIERKEADIARLQYRLEEMATTCNSLEQAASTRADLEAQVYDLQQKLSSANEQVSNVNTLKNSIKEQDLKIVELEKQVACSDKLGDELLTAQLQIQTTNQRLSTQQDVIEKLQKEVLPEAETQLPIIDGDIDKIFSQNTNLSIDLQTDKYQAARDHLTAQAENHAVQQQQGRTDIDPRMIMVAESSCTHARYMKRQDAPLSQINIVPDSQLELHDDGLDESDLRTGPSINRQRTSSPLSDIDEEIFDDVYDDIGSDNEPAAKHSRHTEADIFELPIASPQYPPRYRAKPKFTRRPSSILSQDDMLLQESETGRQTPQRSRRGQRNHLLSGASPTTAPLPRQRKEDVDIHGSSPSRVKHKNAAQKLVSDDTATMANAQNFENTSREVHRPNSAVKRRADHDATGETSEHFNAKRTQLQRARTGSRFIKSDQPASIATAKQPSTDSLPLGSRTSLGSIDGNSSSQKAIKRGKTVRKSTKRENFAEKFNSSSQ